VIALFALARSTTPVPIAIRGSPSGPIAERADHRAHALDPDRSLAKRLEQERKAGREQLARGRCGPSPHLGMHLVERALDRRVDRRESIGEVLHDSIE
jgi:hypothetical protein